MWRLLRTYLCSSPQPSPELLRQMMSHLKKRLKPLRAKPRPQAPHSSNATLMSIRPLCQEVDAAYQTRYVTHVHAEHIVSETNTLIDGARREQETNLGSPLFENEGVGLASARQRDTWRSRQPKRLRQPTHKARKTGSTKTNEKRTSIREGMGSRTWRTWSFMTPMRESS